MKNVNTLLLLLGCLSIGMPSARAGAVQEQPEVDALVRDLDSDDEATREAAIAALAKRPRPTLEKLLSEFGSTSLSKQAKTGVIEVLGRMKKSGAQILEDAMLQRLHVGNMNLVFAIFSAIGDSGPKAAWTSASLVKRIEGVFDQGFKDFNGMVISQAIVALGRLGPTTPKAESVIRKQLKSEDLHIRLASACALWNIGGKPEEVYGVLVEGLQMTQDAVALECSVYGLGEMGSQAKAALTTLETLRDTIKGDTRVTIVDAIRKIEGKLPTEGPRRLVQEPR